MTDQDQQDIRWLQRFDNYQRALARLREGVELAEQRALSDLEQQGFIQGFKSTHELAWNTLKDFMIWQGVGNIIGSRDATRAAFRIGLVEDGMVWMEMIKSRNLSSHTYREEVANEIAEKILNQYFQAFEDLKQTLLSRKDELSNE